MKPQIFIFLIGVLSACNRNQNALNLISQENGAESVYVTQDQKQNPVIVWTERSEDRLALIFAVSTNEGNSFPNKVSLPLTNDVATHAEGMPKVAFKDDGTIIAAYEKKAPTETNKYAGAIYYRSSADGGRTWTEETFLHSDTVAGRSRSYFDIERLSDGEIGAAWLDIKLDMETGGRTVRFAKTNGGTDFTNEVLVDSSACQCCRLEVYSDLTGQVSIAYRGLAKGKMGQPLRDMMLSTSLDAGKTFSPPMKISQDNWSIDGCPHTGPALCSSKSGLLSFWYTEGNGTGIFYSLKRNNESEFGQRQLVSNVGRHPQVSASDTRFVLVWEEISGSSEKKFTNIFYQTGNETAMKRECITPANTNAYSPVVTATGDGFLVAFLMESDAGTGIYFRKI